MKKILLILSSVLVMNFALPMANLAYAENQPLTDATFPVDKILTLDNEQQEKKYFSDTQNSPIVSFILEIINTATIIIGTIAVILIIIGGFMFMFSQGNQQKLDEAKEVIKFAVIGLLVTFLSYVIVIFVQSLFISK